MFSNHHLGIMGVDDGICFEYLFPSAITAQRNRERTASQGLAPRRSMLMDCPLPEDRQVPTPVGRHLVWPTRPTQGRASSLRSVVTNSHPRGAGQLSEGGASGRSLPRGHRAQPGPWTPGRILDDAEGVETVFAELRDRMLGPLPVASVFDEFLSGNRGSTASAMAEGMSALLSFRSEVMSAVRERSTEGGSGPVTQSRRVMVAARSVNGQRPQVAVQVDEWSEPRGTRVRNRNQSGLNNNIIGLANNVSLLSGSFAGSGDDTSARGGEDMWEIDDFSYENLLRLDDGVGKAGLSEAQLRGLKCTPYKASMRRRGVKGGHSNPDGGEICPICLEQLVDGAKVYEMGCGHVSHHSCILPWLRRNNCCPTCRYQVPRLGRH